MKYIATIYNREGLSLGVVAEGDSMKEMLILLSDWLSPNDGCEPLLSDGDSIKFNL